MKKILYIAVSSQTGGVPKHILNALERAQENGYQITVAVPNDGDYFPWFKEAGAIMLDLPLKPYSFQSLWKLKKYVKENQIELIHSHGKGAGMYARPLRVFFPKMKIVHTFHGIYLEQYGALVKTVYCFIERTLKHLTDVFICVSESERQEALHLKFVVPKREQVICNGVEPSRFREVEISKEEYRREFSFPEDTKVIGCVARLEKMKGHICLLEAFARIHAKMPKTRLLLVGDGPDRAMIEEKVNALQLESAVHFAGFRHDIPQLLKFFDVFVSTSLKEGMPYTLIEALAAGVPVVATDVIGNRDVVRDDICGLLAPAEQPDVVAKAIIRLLEDKAISKRLAETGQRMVEEEFTVKHSVDCLFDIYKGLIG